LVFPPAESCGLNINDTIRYSIALSADFLVFVFADAGLSSFMVLILCQMEKWKTARTIPRGFGGWINGQQ
jgi:hypothetical protein